MELMAKCHCGGVEWNDIAFCGVCVQWRSSDVITHLGRDAYWGKLELVATQGMKVPGGSGRVPISEWNNGMASV